MKKSYFGITIVVFIVVFFSSCSPKDNANKSALIGTWKLTGLQLETALDLNNDGVVSSNVLDELAVIDGRLLLSNNGNGTIGYTSDVSLNSTLENDNLFFMVSSSINSDREPLEISYSQSGNMVVINEDVTFNKTHSDMSVLDLTDHILTMKVLNGFVVKDIDTQEITVLQDVTYIFTKQD